MICSSCLYSVLEKQVIVETVPLKEKLLVLPISLLVDGPMGIHLKILDDFQKC